MLACHVTTFAFTVVLDTAFCVIILAVIFAFIVASVLINVEILAISVMLLKL